GAPVARNLRIDAEVQAGHAGDADAAVLDVPLHAIGKLAAELHLHHLRLDVHLQRHHVQPFDHFADRLPGRGRGAHQHRVGLGERRHADALALGLERDPAGAAAILAERHRAAAEPAAAAAAAARRPHHAHRVAFAAAPGVAELATAAADRGRGQPGHQRRTVAATAGAAAAAAEHYGQAFGQV